MFSSRKHCFVGAVLPNQKLLTLVLPRSWRFFANCPQPDDTTTERPHPSAPSLLGPALHTPCWLAQLFARRAPLAPRLAMLPAGQLRYASRTPHAESSRELQQSIYRLIVLFGCRCLSIDTAADELDDLARSVNKLLCRESCVQRPTHRRHRLRPRIDRLVLADVWPQCRCHDTG
jgi:hypothetical protein